MGSEDLEIQLNPVMVNKLQNFLNDSAYREAIQSAASYNANLASERAMRLPFLDSQTGVAQNHSNLFFEPRQRLPGLKEGQIYTYPAKRWRKKRRQYLTNYLQPKYPTRKDIPEDPDAHAITTVENIAFNSSANATMINEDSKDSSISFKEDAKSKEAWYYDELDLPDAGEFDEPDADSDYDYEESYSKKKKKGGVRSKSARSPATPRAPKRKITYDPITDAEKPFACDLCGARYKTRPGLTYHYTHSHKDKEDEDEDDLIPSSPKRDDGRRHSRGPQPPMPAPPVLLPQQQMNPMQMMPPSMQPQGPPPPHHLHMAGGGHMPPHPQGPPGGPMMQHPPGMMHHPPPHLLPQQPPHPHGMGMHPQPPNMGNPIPVSMGPQGPPPGMQMQPPRPQLPVPMQQPPPPPPQQQPHQHQAAQEEPEAPKSKIDNDKPRVQPNSYCDFCLGDAAENKKSGGPEELVSCSDCGRSGHPTCLQFTQNMIISVKKYRWQCIECKCCSLCGLSDNDDQLLFCDDCDRGYHMYCLKPPLESPPEGSWSCTLCLEEFHKK